MLIAGNSFPKRQRDIVAVMGLRGARTGDTITAPHAPVLLERVDEYHPVISLALEPRNSEEGKTLDEALERYQAEDPTLTASLDEGSGHRIVSGMGGTKISVSQPWADKESLRLVTARST